MNLVEELVRGTRQLSHGGVKARASEERGSTRGQTMAPGPGAKCEECHVIILDTVHCAV